MIQWGRKSWRDGVGCRGGFCGSCAIRYRKADNYKLRPALACQTTVEDGMHLAAIPFVLNYIPSIGSILASIPAISLALITLGWLPAFALAIGYALINLLIGILIEPRWAGQATDLSPTVVVLSMVFWGFVLGPIGALLSVPLTIIVRMTAAQSTEWSWLAMLLGSSRSMRNSP